MRFEHIYEDLQENLKYKLSAIKHFCVATNDYHIYPLDLNSELEKYNKSKSGEYAIKSSFIDETGKENVIEYKLLITDKNKFLYQEKSFQYGDEAGIYIAENLTTGNSDLVILKRTIKGGFEREVPLLKALNRLIDTYQSIETHYPKNYIFMNLENGLECNCGFAPKLTTETLIKFIKNSLQEYLSIAELGYWDTDATKDILYLPLENTLRIIDFGMYEPFQKEHAEYFCTLQWGEGIYIHPTRVLLVYIAKAIENILDPDKLPAEIKEIFFEQRKTVKLHITAAITIVEKHIRNFTSSPSNITTSPRKLSYLFQESKAEKIEDTNLNILEQFEPTQHIGIK